MGGASQSQHRGVARRPGSSGAQYLSPQRGPAQFMLPSVNYLTREPSLRASATGVPATAFSAPRADAQAHGPSVRDMKDGNMKTLITAVALAITLIAVPAITQSALAASPNDVIVNGKNIGTDPDANVRYQMRRDVGSEGF
jgi:hypothetical protein